MRLARYRASPLRYKDLVFQFGFRFTKNAQGQWVWTGFEPAMPEATAVLTAHYSQEPCTQFLLQ